MDLLLRTEDALAVQKQVEAQLLLLVEASSALIESPDSKQLLGTILKLAQRFVGADAYGVLRRRAADSEWDVVATEGLSEGYMVPSAPGRAAILDGLSAPCPVEDVETSALMAHRKPHHRAEGIRSLLIVPLRTPGGTDGDIIFYYRTPHRFNELELRVAGGLGNLAAAALESAVLYEKQTQLRRIAEAAQRRAGFLAEAGKVLWSSLDYEVTLAGVVRLAVPEIADEVCIYVTDQDGTLRPVAGRLLSVDVAAVSAQTGTPALLADLIAVPLLAPGRTLGAIVMKMTGGQREFTDSDLALAEDLAVRIAAAIANTQLYQESLEAGLALQKLNSELKRANEDLNQFAYSASHDLQEPLRMVAIYSQMLATEFGGRLGERGDLYIRYAVQGAKQMQMLVRDILAYTRAGDVSDQKITPVAVGLALGTVLVNLDTAIQETGAEIEAGDLPEVMVHEVHLVQLLQNLVGNALKYRGREKPKVRISAELEGDRWRISVQDNGIGIAPEYAEQVFGIFKRLHSAAEYPGTGVGLAICQKIVERYGGRIGVESVEGAGSVFWFTLPGA